MQNEIRTYLQPPKMVPIFVRSNGPPPTNHVAEHPGCIGQKFGKRMLSPNKPKQAINHPPSSDSEPSSLTPYTCNPKPFPYPTAQSARSPLNANQPTENKSQSRQTVHSFFNPQTITPFSRPPNMTRSVLPKQQHRLRSAPTH